MASANPILGGQGRARERERGESERGRGKSNFFHFEPVPYLTLQSAVDYPTQLCSDQSESLKDKDK